VRLLAAAGAAASIPSVELGVDLPVPPSQVDVEFLANPDPAIRLKGTGTFDATVAVTHNSSKRRRVMVAYDDLPGEGTIKLVSPPVISRLVWTATATTKAVTASFTDSKDGAIDHRYTFGLTKVPSSVELTMTLGVVKLAASGPLASISAEARRGLGLFGYTRMRRARLELTGVPKAFTADLRGGPNAYAIDVPSGRIDRIELDCSDVEEPELGKAPLPQGAPGNVVATPQLEPASFLLADEPDRFQLTGKLFDVRRVSISGGGGPFELTWRASAGRALLADVRRRADPAAARSLRVAVGKLPGSLAVHAEAARVTFGASARVPSIAVDLRDSSSPVPSPDVDVNLTDVPGFVELTQADGITRLVAPGRIGAIEARIADDAALPTYGLPKGADGLNVVDTATRHSTYLRFTGLRHARLQQRKAGDPRPLRIDLTTDGGRRLVTRINRSATLPSTVAALDVAALPSSLMFATGPRGNAQWRASAGGTEVTGDVLIDAGPGPAGDLDLAFGAKNLPKQLLYSVQPDGGRVVEASAPVGLLQLAVGDGAKVGKAPARDRVEVHQRLTSGIDRIRVALRGLRYAAMAPKPRAGFVVRVRTASRRTTDIKLAGPPAFYEEDAVEGVLSGRPTSWRLAFLPGDADEATRLQWDAAETLKRLRLSGYREDLVPSWKEFPERFEFGLDDLPRKVRMKLAPDGGIRFDAPGGMGRVSARVRSAPRNALPITAPVLGDGVDGGSYRSVATGWSDIGSGVAREIDKGRRYRLYILEHPPPHDPALLNDKNADEAVKDALRAWRKPFDDQIALLTSQRAEQLYDARLRVRGVSLVRLLAAGGGLELQRSQRTDVRVRAQIEDPYAVYHHDTLIDARVDDAPKRLTFSKVATGDSTPQGLTTKPVGTRDVMTFTSSESIPRMRALYFRDRHDSERHDLAKPVLRAEADVRDLPTFLELCMSMDRGCTHAPLTEIAGKNGTFPGLWYRFGEQLDDANGDGQDDRDDHLGSYRIRSEGGNPKVDLELCIRWCMPGGPGSQHGDRPWVLTLGDVTIPKYLEFEAKFRDVTEGTYVDSNPQALKTPFQGWFWLDTNNTPVSGSVGFRTDIRQFKGFHMGLGTFRAQNAMFGLDLYSALDPRTLTFFHYGKKACSKAPFATVDFEFPSLIDDGIAESVAESLGTKVATAMVAALLCG
jgi:hypothetical protein